MHKSLFSNFVFNLISGKKFSSKSFQNKKKMKLQQTLRLRELYNCPNEAHAKACCASFGLFFFSLRFTLIQKCSVFILMYSISVDATETRQTYNYSKIEETNKALTRWRKNNIDQSLTDIVNVLPGQSIN